MKIGKDWLIYYDAYGEKRYAAKRTNDFKSFKDVSSETVIPERHKHGTIVPVDRKVIKGLRQDGKKENK
ncbi:hypothetical protein D3C86_1875750 [compost metagenome]